LASLLASGNNDVSLSLIKKALGDETVTSATAAVAFEALNLLVRDSTLRAGCLFGQSVQSPVFFSRMYGYTANEPTCVVGYDDIFP
jgi:hypothetical protein